MLLIVLCLDWSVSIWGISYRLDMSLLAAIAAATIVAPPIANAVKKPIDTPTALATVNPIAATATTTCGISSNP